MRAYMSSFDEKHRWGFLFIVLSWQSVTRVGKGMDSFFSLMMTQCHVLLQGAISLSAAPVLATRAEAAPTCAAASRAPRCGRGSNWRGKFWTLDPWVGTSVLCSSRDIWFSLLPVVDTKSLFEDQTSVPQSNYNEV